MVIGCRCRNGCGSRPAAFAPQASQQVRRADELIVEDQPGKMMERAEFHRHIGDENMLPSLDAALARARAVQPSDGLGVARQAVAVSSA
jgi:hypothetical protein